MRLASCAACLVVGISTHAQASNYFEGGDFLLPIPLAGSYDLVPTTERYGVWRVVGESGNVAYVSGSYVHNGFSFPAETSPTTNPWVNLAGLSRTKTGVAHYPVATTVGQSYKLTFYVGNVVDPSGYYGTSSTVLVYENSKLLMTAVNSDGEGSTRQNWKAFSVTFSADAPFTTIAMVNGDPPNDRHCGIDHVQLAPVNSGTITSAGGLQQ
jgi:hypothetical protein